MTVLAGGESEGGGKTELKTPCVVYYIHSGFCPELFHVEFFDGGCGGEGKTHNSSPTPSLRRITPPKLDIIPHEDLVVSIGSTVYVLGTFGRAVFYFDTNHEEEGWKRGADMLATRNGGKAIAVEGKIYAFGDINFYKAQEPWGEVFYPVTDEWNPLPCPPVYLNYNDLRQPIVAYGGPSNKTIMMGGRIKYLYHVNTGTWEQLKSSIYMRRDANLIGAANNVYYTNDGKLCAVNMKTGRHYEGEIQGSKLGRPKEFCGHYCDSDSSYEEPRLVHLGGKEFCFFTSKQLPKGQTKVCCTTFRVSKRVRPSPHKDDDKWGKAPGVLEGYVLSTVSSFSEPTDNNRHLYTRGPSSSRKIYFDELPDDHGQGQLLDGMVDAIKDAKGSASKAEDEQEVVVKGKKRRRKEKQRKS